MPYVTIVAIIDNISYLFHNTHIEFLDLINSRPLYWCLVQVPNTFFYAKSIACDKLEFVTIFCANLLFYIESRKIVEEDKKFDE